MKSELKSCCICGSEFAEDLPLSDYAAAGELLAEEIWQDSGKLCAQCLENRARLAMMYIIDR